MPTVTHEGFTPDPNPDGKSCCAGIPRIFTQEELDGLLFELSHPKGTKVRLPPDDVPPDPRKWTEETLSAMTYRRACLAFGSGDLGRGKQLIFMLARRLEEAREKHKRFAEGAYQALGIIGAEYNELVNAVEHETHDRAIDEALDVAATCMRFIGKEHVCGR